MEQTRTRLKMLMHRSDGRLLFFGNRMSVHNLNISLINFHLIGTRCCRTRDSKRAFNRNAKNLDMHLHNLYKRNLILKKSIGNPENGRYQLKCSANAPNKFHVNTIVVIIVIDDSVVHNLLAHLSIEKKRATLKKREKRWIIFYDRKFLFTVNIYAYILSTVDFTVHRFFCRCREEKKNSQKISISVKKKNLFLFRTFLCSVFHLSIEIFAHFYFHLDCFICMSFSFVCCPLYYMYIWDTRAF